MSETATQVVRRMLNNDMEVDEIVKELKGKGFSLQGTTTALATVGFVVNINEDRKGTRINITATSLKHDEVTPTFIALAALSRDNTVSVVW